MIQWADALWNRSVPYPEPERLVRVFQVRGGSRDNLSPPNYFDLGGGDGRCSPESPRTGARA